MSQNRNDPLRLTRRVTLRGAAVALGVAAAGSLVSRATAQQKISQAIANYQNMAQGDDRCGLCENFQAPNACRFVQGEIQPQGWCQLFAAKS